MSDARDTAIGLSVRLKPSELSVYPQAVNYTNADVAQGIAYLDFGFIEPALLAAIAKTAKDGQAAPNGLDGHFVMRVAMGVDVLVVAAADTASAGLLRDARQSKPKE